MPDGPLYRIAYFAHSLRSDWNNGNAHFLRGLLRALQALGHTITVFEPADEWSIENLQAEPNGAASLQQFTAAYPDLRVETYAPVFTAEPWHERLGNTQFVLLHEWNPPALAQHLLALRPQLSFRLLFHDTHHRASSSPEQMERFGLPSFNGIVVFGESLRTLYREHFGLERVWTLHEAADTSLFHPLPETEKMTDAVWIGNWGDGERTREIADFYLEPARRLRHEARFRIFGVRYPRSGLDALAAAGVSYGSYLPNLEAPRVYAEARLTVHIPRQQYQTAMVGIPTIRVFEALACGIPLISAPWPDTEHLFAPGDFLWAHNTDEMTAAMRLLLHDPAAAADQARQGLATVLARHTCAHRAHELTHILEEIAP